MIFDLNRYPVANLRGEMRRLMVLALPMMLGQVATLAIGVADIAMAGKAGKDDLAAVALGSSAFSTLFVTFMGVMAALNPIIAQQHGAGGGRAIGETGRQGVWFGLILGIAGMVLLFALIAPLHLFFGGVMWLWGQPLWGIPVCILSISLQTGTILHNYDGSRRKARREARKAAREAAKSR